MLKHGGTQVVAGAVLGLFALFMVAWTWRAFRRTQYGPLQFAIFTFNTLMTRILWRAKVSGEIGVPSGQGAVIVCNHIGPIDPAFIALGVNRVVHWMIAREYCELPLLGWFFRSVGAISVGRGGIDTAAAKSAIRYAESGELVGIFPEGRINDTGQMLLPGRPGAAMIALRARVPLVPCYVTGAPNDGTLFGFLLTPARARLRIGRPIDISAYYDRAGDREVQQELTKRILLEIARLAGVADFQPRLAGRRWKKGEDSAPVDEAPTVR